MEVLLESHAFGGPPSMVDTALVSTNSNTRTQTETHRESARMKVCM